MATVTGLSQALMAPSSVDSRLFPALPKRVSERVLGMRSAYYASKDVIAAEPNHRFQVADVLNDPSFSKQWSLESPTAVHIDATRAWGLYKGSHSLKIPVLDTGIDRTHPEFSDNIWSNPLKVAGDGIDNDANGWDFTINALGVIRSNGDNDPTDGHGHSTHVSGIIAAQGNNATGVTGICWDAVILPLKIAGNDGRDLTSWMIAAVEYCVRNGIPVANASIGGTVVSLTSASLALGVSEASWYLRDIHRFHSLLHRTQSPKQFP